jgi:hypothetical protein
MASVYVERNHQSQGEYDGVQRVELSRNQIRIVIGECIVKRMRDREFEIDFTLPPNEFERLRDGLRTVFAGFSVLTEILA